MPHTLSLRDSRQARECARVLAMPFDFAGFEEWSKEATERLSVVLGADKATFAVTDGSHVHTRSDVVAQTALCEYIECYLYTDKWQLLSRAMELGAFNRALVWAENRDEILASPYWNDLVKPQRCFDTVGITASVNSASDFANIQFYHERETGPRFGPRGLAILRAVYPAFAAGCRTWMALHGYSRRLSSFIDTLPSAVLLSRSDGSVLHQNHALRRMLDCESTPALRTAIKGAIDAFRRTWVRHGPAMAPLPPRPTASETTIDGRTFRITASLLGREVLPGSGAIVAVVEALGRPQFPAAILRERHNLTPREVEVTRLLAEGKTNSEIAASLGVSTFTARHHTESVMAKLGVTARGKVAGVIARLTRD